MTTKTLCKGLRKANSLVCQLKTKYHQHRCLSNRTSLVGFNDYEAGVRDFKLTTPTYYNFTTDVIDKWAREESVGIPN